MLELMMLKGKIKEQETLIFLTSDYPILFRLAHQNNFYPLNMS
jgi:hypothetical protein